MSTSLKSGEVTYGYIKTDNPWTVVVNKREGVNGICGEWDYE